MSHSCCFFSASECNCNGHSDRCTFDPAVYEANGGISGGVCLDCQHNTMGRNCQQCRDMFYQDPYQDIRSSTICKRMYYIQGGIIIAWGFVRNTPPLPSPPQIFFIQPLPMKMKKCHKVKVLFEPLKLNFFSQPHA